MANNSWFKGTRKKHAEIRDLIESVPMHTFLDRYIDRLVGRGKLDERFANPDVRAIAKENALQYLAGVAKLESDGMSGTPTYTDRKTGKPATSAMGLFQMTRPTIEQAQKRLARFFPEEERERILDKRMDEQLRKHGMGYDEKTEEGVPPWMQALLAGANLAEKNFVNREGKVVPGLGDTTWAKVFSGDSTGATRNYMLGHHTEYVKGKDGKNIYTENPEKAAELETIRGRVGDYMGGVNFVNPVAAKVAQRSEDERVPQDFPFYAGGGTVQTAKGLAALGRGPDNQLVHMAPKEVAALQRLATAAGGSLTINPETGLVEAGFLEDWLPTIVGLGMAPFTGGASAFLVPAAAGLGAAAITGDWKQGLKWGLGVSGGMGIGHAFGAGGAAAGISGTPGTRVPLNIPSTQRLMPNPPPLPKNLPKDIYPIPGVSVGSGPTALGQVAGPSGLSVPLMRSPGGVLKNYRVSNMPTDIYDLPSASGPFSFRGAADQWKEGMGRFGKNITSGASWKDAWQSGKLKVPLAASVASGGLGAYGRSLEEFEGPKDTSDKPAGYPEEAPHGYIASRRDVTLPQRLAGDTSEMSYFDPDPYPNPVGYEPYDPTDERFYAAEGGLVNLPRYQEGGTVAATPDAGEVSYLSSFTGATDAGLPASDDTGGGEVAYFPRDRGGMGINMDITEYLESLDARGIPRMTGFSGPRAPTDLSALSGDRAWYHYPDPETQDPATNPFPLGVFYRPANQFMAGGVFTPTRPFESYTPGGSAPYDIQTETLGTITSEDKNPNTPWGSRDKTYGEYMSTQEQALRGRWPYDQYQDYMVNMSALRGGTPATPGWRNIGPMEGGHPRIPGEVYDIPVPTRAPYGFGAGILRGTPKIDLPRAAGAGPGGTLLPSTRPGHAFMASPSAVRRPFGENPLFHSPIPLTLEEDNLPNLFGSSQARQFMAAGGPVEGAGDGTSDSVPAKIDDQQPAALSTGEFVISADVVSGLGNGDTDAGAEQLYALMDRVRSKRSNGDKQPPTLRPRGLMPA